MANTSVIAINASGDTHIVNSAGSPGDDVFIRVRGTPLTHALVKWSLAAIPAGSTINKAVFSFTSLLADSDGQSIEVFRLIRDWVELEATWALAQTGDNWGTAGAENVSTDYNNTVLGTLTYIGGVDPEVQEIDITQTVSDWFDGSTSNFGLKLSDTTSDSSSFHTRENTLNRIPPRLVVTYTAVAMDYQLNSNNIDCGIQVHWAPIATGKNANATQKTSVNWRRHTWSMAFCEMGDWEILEPTRGTSFTELKTTGHSTPNTVNTYSTGRVMGVTGRQVGRRMENVKVDYLVDISS